MATRSNRSSSRRAHPRRKISASRPANRPTSRSRRASNGGRPWSSQELTFLRKFYRTQSTSWVARQLGRTVYSVRYKASDLSIKKANPSVWKNNTSNGTSRRGTASKTRWAASSRRRASRTSRTRRSGRGRR